MASSSLTYTPDSLPTPDVKSLASDSSPSAKASVSTPFFWDSNATYPGHSDLAHSLHTASDELVKPDSKLGVVSFTSANGSPIMTTSKTAPVPVSGTSICVKFRLGEAAGGPPTLPSTMRGFALSTERPPTKREPQPASASPPASHSFVSGSLPPAERPDIASGHLIGSTSPIHKQVVGHQLSSSPDVRDSMATIPSASEERTDLSWTPGRHVLTSPPTTRSQSIPPISAASNVPPPLSRNTTFAYPASTADISSTSSPRMGTSQPALVNVTTPNPDLERGKPDRYRKGSATGGTSGSSSIVQSRYTDMVFEEVPRMHNFLSGLFTWTVLAGFVALPGTFTTIEGIQTKSGEFQRVLHDIQHLPLLVVGYACCGFGGLGMLLLWWRWAHNYVWLLNSIFIPGTLNGLSGLISTFASIYGAQGGVYGTSSIITLAVTGACTLVCGILTTIYSVWKLGRVKRLHKREMEQVKTVEIGERHYIS